MTTMQMPAKQDLTPPIDDAPDLRIASTDEPITGLVEDDKSQPRIDADGNLCHGFEYIDVPLRPAVLVESAFVLVAECDGWLTGWGWDPQSKNPTPEMPSLEDRSATLNISRPRFSSRGSAIAHALRQLEQSARLWAVPMGEMLAEDIASLHDEEYADWAEFLKDEGKSEEDNQDEESGAAADPATLAEQPDAEEIAEYQDGVAGLEAQGVTVGEPVPTTGEQPGERPEKEDGRPIARGIPDVQPTYRQQLRDAADLLAETTLAELLAAAEHKSAKARRQLAAESLQGLVSRGPQSYPLWESETEEAEPAKPAAAAADSVDQDQKNKSAAKAVEAMQEQPPSTVVNPEAWKAEPIESLGLPSGVVATLQGAGIDTIGRLEQRRADISNGREVWPKGIGEAKITKIENAIIAWLTKNGPQAN